MSQYNRANKISLTGRIVNTLRKANLVIMCLVFALVLSIWGGILWWRTSHFADRFQFHRIKIVMPQGHLTPETIVKIVHHNLRGGFFSLDTTRLRKALKAEPWVAEIAFRRLWPSTLEVDVREQQPVAIWANKSLINAQGEIFSPQRSSFPKNLAKLNGPNESAKQVLKKFSEFQALLKSTKIMITELNLSPRNAWRLVVNNQLTVILGQTDIDNVFKRFITLYPKIIMHNKEVALSVDMRYPNGAAVLWGQQKPSPVLKK